MNRLTQPHFKNPTDRVIPLPLRYISFIFKRIIYRVTGGPFLCVLMCHDTGKFSKIQKMGQDMLQGYSTPSSTSIYSISCTFFAEDFEGTSQVLLRFFVQRSSLRFNNINQIFHKCSFYSLLPFLRH